MALIGVYNPSSGGSGDTLGSEVEDFVQDEEFSSGLELVLSPPGGSTILTGTLIINYNEKLLVRGASYDYTFDGVDTITILFGDDPTQYANGEVIFQVSYAYTT